MEEFRKSARGQVLIRGALMLVFGLLLNLGLTLVGGVGLYSILVDADHNRSEPIHC